MRTSFKIEGNSEDKFNYNGWLNKASDSVDMIYTI